MALDKKGKPASSAKNGKSASADSNKSNPVSNALKKIHPNYYYLAFVLILVFGVGMVVYVYYGSGADAKETKDPNAMQMVGEHPYGDPVTPSPKESSNSKASEAKATQAPQTASLSETPAATPTVQATPVPTIVPFNLSDYSRPAEEVKRAVEEYLKKYDQAVQSGDFASLATWARDKGLSVEVSRLSRMEALVPTVPAITRNTRWPMHAQEAGWRFITQQDYETRLWSLQMSHKPVQRDYSYRQIAGEMDQLQPGGGMSNQTHLVEAGTLGYLDLAVDDDEHLLARIAFGEDDFSL